MDRRKVLLVVAAVIAALGTLLVFLYVRGADQRADQRYDAVQVLRAVKPIAPGETVEAAQAAGKIESGTVSRKDLLADALTGLEPVAGKIAITAIAPGEQIVGSKFGLVGAASALTIPKGKIAISVQLGDPSRVAGFVNPGDNVAIFLTAANDQDKYTRLLLPKVLVIGAGATTVTTTTTTDPAGAQTQEQLPRALLTIAVTQDEAERVLFATANGELAFGLLNNDSQVAPSPGINKGNLFR